MSEDIPTFTPPAGWQSRGSIIPAAEWQQVEATSDSAFLFYNFAPPYQQIKLEVAETDEVIWVPTGIQIKADPTPIVQILEPSPVLNPVRSLSFRLVEPDWDFIHWKLEVFSMPLSRAVNVTITPTTSSSVTPTSVTSTTANQTILGSNPNRKGASIWNNSTATLSLELGGTSSTSAYSVQLGSMDYYEVPYGFTGNITGLWSAANGNALVREFV